MFFRSGQWSVCCQSCANEADISSSVSVHELLKDMAEMDAEAVAEMRDVDEARSGVPVDPRRISRQDENDDVGHQTAFDQIHRFHAYVLVHFSQYLRLMTNGSISGFCGAFFSDAWLVIMLAVLTSAWSCCGTCA